MGPAVAILARALFHSHRRTFFISSARRVSRRIAATPPVSTKHGFLKLFTVGSCSLAMGGCVGKQAADFLENAELFKAGDDELY